MMSLSGSNGNEININENGNMILNIMRIYRERYDKIFLFAGIFIFFIYCIL